MKKRHRAREIIFERVERDCEANRRAQQKGSKYRIYDFNVLIDGQHRATLLCEFGRGYEILDLDRRPIRAARRVRGAGEDRGDFVRKQADFLPFVRGLLTAHRIPPWRDIQARRAREAARAAAARVAAAKIVRDRAASRHGPELLEMLRLTLPAVERASDAAILQRVRAVIAKAEPAGDAFERELEHELWRMRRKPNGA